MTEFVYLRLHDNSLQLFFFQDIAVRPTPITISVSSSVVSVTKSTRCWLTFTSGQLTCPSLIWFLFHIVSAARFCPVLWRRSQNPSESHEIKADIWRWNKQTPSRRVFSSREGERNSDGETLASPRDETGSLNSSRKSAGHQSQSCVKSN